MSYSNQVNQGAAPPRPGNAPPTGGGAQVQPTLAQPAQAQPAPTQTLTEKQLSWAQAFMRAMGMASELDAKIVPETNSSKIKGNLVFRDEAQERSTANSLRSNAGVKGSGEKVGRGMLRGAGKGYGRDVVDRVNLVIKKAKSFAESGTVSTEISKLIADLTAARDGYEQREQGEEDAAKLDQRQRKVAAIDDRIEALEQLLRDQTQSKLVEVMHMNNAEKQEALVENPAILAVLAEKQPGDERVVAAMKKLAETHPEGFSAHPDMFEAYLDTQPAPKAVLDVLAAADGTSSDALVKVIVDCYGGDARMMNVLCQDIVTAETGKQESTGTFFRGNTAATKLTKAFAQCGPESKAYLDDTVDLRNRVFDRLPKDARIEIDPAKLKDVPDQADVMAKSLRFVTQSCDIMLKMLYNKKVPANVATTAAMIAAAARSKKLPEDQVATMIGGHLLLRIINPMLTQTKKPNDTALAGNEQRLVVLITKVMQNISNHMTAMKEDFMQPLAGYTSGKFAEMDAWCLKVAKDGESLLSGSK